MKKLIVYFSVVPINSPPNSVINTARYLAKENTLLFIEIPVFEKNYSYKDALILPIKLASVFQNLTSKSNNLVSIKSPQSIPNSKFRKITFLSILLFIRLFKLITKCRTVLYTTCPEKNEIYSYIPSDIKLFECMDIFRPNQIKKNKKWLNSFDHILVNSLNIKTYLKSLGIKNTVMISPGYIGNKWQKLKNIDWRKIRKIKNSVVFCGGISRRINYSLLWKLIKSLPSHKFYFIGELYLGKYYGIHPHDNYCLEKWNSIKKLPNVIYLENKSENYLIKKLPLFHIGIIPYKTSDYFNVYSNPIKLYEYLLSGLVVISTKLPIIKELSQDNYPILSANEFNLMKYYIQKYSSISSSKVVNWNDKLYQKVSIENKIKSISKLVDGIKV